MKLENAKLLKMLLKWKQTKSVSLASEICDYLCDQIGR
jgi:hypothetical protein